MPKLLILASNPRRDLNLDREVSDLNNAVQRLGDLKVVLGLGVRSQELQELLAEHSPQFVHFCGHGAGDRGLVFQDENGREQLMSTEILARIFKIFANEIHCTVLNACDSDRQAEAIAQQIQYVVGMSQPILDQAAHLFAVGFYKGLAAQKTIEQAFEMGCIAIQIWYDTQPQSTLSRQYRDLGTAEEDAQSTSSSLPEYQKPVLLKEGIRWIPDVGRYISSDHSEAFVNFIRQEIERKDYKDRAREAYDNFGQYSAQNIVSLTKSECKQRKILLDKVKQFWIEGFLKPSLQGFSAIHLDLKARPDAIADLTQGIEALSLELDASYEQIRPTQIYGEMGQGRTLLILGEPGAGKTIALLQLAQRLIDRSEQNLSLPIPVVFNLSSWAKDRKAIVDWAIDELREKYQVPKSLSKPWMGQQQLILLLDGLDEVSQEHRNDCVCALNQFIGLFPQTEVAVCSRVRDYEALTERLQISSAFCLQPLTSEQVYQFLDNFGGSLGGLKTILKSDAELERFAQTPLILNFMSSAYQGWSVRKLLDELRSTSDRSQHLFDAYIDCRLERGSALEYPKDKVLHWLTWLAKRMTHDKRTIFLIDQMQPSLLKNGCERFFYQIINFTTTEIIGVLISGLFGFVWLILILFFGLNYMVSGKPNEWMPFLLMYVFIVGLIVGSTSGLMTGLQRSIKPLYRLSWSWKRTKSKFVREIFMGFIYGLFFCFFTVLMLWIFVINILDDYTDHEKFEALISTLNGGFTYFLQIVLISGLFFGSFSGIGNSEIERHTFPNQGIRSSLRNCCIMGIGINLTVLLIVVGIYSPNLESSSKLTDLLLIGELFGLVSGMITGIKYGGAACIQHFTLRQMLYKKGCIPWNYAKFLDFASGRLLIKRVGGGYVFFHRMLLEHFAQMHSK
jgi:hypothetical protein